MQAPGPHRPAGAGCLRLGWRLALQWPHAATIPATIRRSAAIDPHAPLTAPPLPGSTDTATVRPATLAATRDAALDRSRRMVWLAVLVPLAAFAAVAAWLHHRAYADASIALDRAARIAQEHALKLFDTNEMLLQRMLDLAGDEPDAQALARSAQMHAQLRAMAARLPQVQGLFILGTDSRALAMSVRHPAPRDIDYSDREWYRWHRERPGDGVFFTGQLVSRSTGEPFFDMSRRRTLADGSFGGTVNVSLRPAYLTQFYEELGRTEPDLRFAVFRSDGAMIARWPSPMAAGSTLPADHPVLRAIAAGAAEGRVTGERSTFDGGAHTTVFRRLDPYSLYVLVSLTHDAVGAGWLRRVGLIAAAAVPLTLALALLALQAHRRNRDELSALQRLDDETAQRQRIELALLQSQKLEAMGRLTGGVAHDFNNLLMIVSTNLYLLRRQLPEGSGATQIAAMERAIGSGTKLTRQLLAFARRQALRPERVQLQDRLPSLLELLRPVLGSGIEVTGGVDAGTDPVLVDPAELELALINLAVNAKDAMPSGGRLDVRARNARPGEGPAGGAFVVVEVRDEGTGVDEALLGRVFDAFFTTKPVGYGTGLGLSQVQALAASTGGVARIENRPEGGACVRVFLGSAPPDAQDAPGALPPQAPRTLDLRILLVEDNDGVAQATAELLQSLGCSVRRVPEPNAALAALAAGCDAYDVVLSDIEMPQADGIGLAIQLKQRCPALPVLLMTGYAARLEQAVQQQLDVLPKPCAPAVLADALARAAARRPGPA